jgi:hypothetical protein
MGNNFGCIMIKIKKNNLDWTVTGEGSVHLAKRFQRRKSLEIDLLQTRIAYGGHVC